MVFQGRRSEYSACQFSLQDETLAATLTTMNQIIAKEIRAGNYLFRMPSEMDIQRGLTNPIIEVVDDVEWIGNYFRINYLSQDDYEPIPLTTDWLLKLGFLQSKDNKIEFVLKIGDVAMLTVIEVPHSVYSIKNSILWQITEPIHLRKRVMYVHTLQNNVELISDKQLK